MIAIIYPTTAWGSKFISLAIFELSAAIAYTLTRPKLYSVIN
ncbi:MAG: hypothetical protein AAF298_16670 [Cyanobacteria bacterium P01_A01_bin.40]